MVLDYDEPSPSSSSTSFGDDTPMSDSDPYFSSQKDAHNLLAKFPTSITLPPFTLTRRILHWRQKSYETQLSMMIRAKMDMAAAMVNRLPTQEETDAIVDQSSMLFDIPKAMGLVGASFGAWLWSRQEKFERKQAGVKTFKLAALFRKNMLSITMVRGGLMLPFFFAAGYWIGNTVSRVGVSVATARDERMAQFQRDFEEQDPKEIQKRLQRLRDEAAAKRHAAAAQRLQQRQQQQQPQAQFAPSRDDASPTGSYLESGDSFTQPSDSKILTEVYSQQNGAFQPTPSRPSGQQLSTQPPRSQSFWDNDDDASPANPDIDTTLQTASSSASAWERIRQSAAAQGSSSPRGFTPRSPQAPPQQQQTQQQPSNDDWQAAGSSGAGRDSGDRYARGAKEQAQRNFDQLVERDREFGTDQDRDGGNAWGRRW
ncbi:hypothetical protein PRK78_002391 [Emydomyces testavorans]|uniref:Uncharacterized protein n=1 Tax=Emydomyces testavorans TaxID=2070801 RepID=A0AAF0DG99_9EURO|nr:hypothetical protein PRK78_002391 [Emydomyces testavorans]